MEGLTVKEEMKFQAGLYAKIEKIGFEIGALKKEGNNTFSRYKYITHEQIQTALRPLLVKHSLSITMEVINHVEKEFKSDKGKLTTRSIVDAVFMIVDTETGYFQKVAFPGAEQDNGGKSLQQAITQAQKYFLFKTFKVTDKDADGDQKTTTIQSPKKAAPTKPQTPKAPAPKLSDLKKVLNDIHTTEGVKAFYLSHGNKDYPAGLRAAVIARNEEIVKELEAEKAPEKKTVGGVLSWTLTSKSNPGQQYKITQGKKTGWGCTCKAFQTRKKGELCKHINEIIETIASNGKGQ